MERYPSALKVVADLPAELQSPAIPSPINNESIRPILMVESGLVNVRSLMTHTFPLEQAQQAFLTAQRCEGLKVIVTL